MSKVMNKKFRNVDRKTMFKDHISLKFYPFISLLNSCYSNLLLSRRRDFIKIFLLFAK